MVLVLPHRNVGQRRVSGEISSSSRQQARKKLWHPYRGMTHTRGRTLLSQAPHTNDSILSREHSPRTIIVKCPSCAVDPTDPERSRTPTAELHHSGTMMPRHTTGNPRYETADIRRPVSSHRIHQTPAGIGILLCSGLPVCQGWLASKDVGGRSSNMVL